MTDPRLRAGTANGLFDLTGEHQKFLGGHKSPRSRWMPGFQEPGNCTDLSVRKAPLPQGFGFSAKVEVSDQVQRNFKLVPDEVVKQQIAYILTRHSRPVAALIPYEEYRQYQSFKEKELQEQFDQLRERMTTKSGEFSQEEIEADIRAAIDASRAT